MEQILMHLGIFAVSLYILLQASDFFVEAAERIGLAAGIPPFIIGVTIVALGTSLPELASSIEAVLMGDSKIVIGNVAGSNIANIGLVLGLVGVVGKQVKVKDGIMNIDIPILVSSAFLLWFVAHDQVVTIFEAIILLGALAVFFFFFLNNNEGEETEKTKINGKDIGILILAGIAIKFSAEYTIKSIIELSKLLEIGSEVIAASVVALGTSLPEVFVSLAAIRKGKTDIAVGNILGSNIFNTYAVMGIPALVGTLVIPDNVVHFVLPYMIAMTILFAVMCISKKISRWEGLMLLIFYGLFMVELFSDL
ncbi:MAG: calcium/sodium antiporter [Saprospiraceae bacterium]